VKLQVKVKKETKIIDSCFEELEEKGVFTKIKTAVFKSVFKARVNGFYNLVRFKTKKYNVEEGKNYFILEETGNAEDVKVFKKELENFLNNTEDSLKDTVEYKNCKKDRTFRSVFRILTKRSEVWKNKFVKGFLGGMSVKQFFFSIGIQVEWKVLE